MGRLAVQPSSTIRPWRRCRLFWAGLVCLHLCGCANFWDEVTDRDFWSNPGQLFKTPDPVAVLQDPNADGTKRYKALAQLREPLANGGTQQEQEQIFNILEKAATQDQAPVCRLAALSALGRFKDARAATVIDSVFDQQLPFAKEMNTLVREQCLMALIDTGSPVALNRLVLVAKDPPANGPTEERLETLDRQLIAVRGLAKFKQPEAATALACVLCATRRTMQPCAEPPALRVAGRLHGEGLAGRFAVMAIVCATEPGGESGGWQRHHGEHTGHAGFCIKADWLSAGTPTAAAPGPGNRFGWATSRGEPDQRASACPRAATGDCATTTADVVPGFAVIIQ